MTNKRTPFARFRNALDPALTVARPLWATSTIAVAHGPAAMDPTALSAHMGRCNGLRGRMFVLRSAADSFGSFWAPRTVTALVALGILVGLGTLFV